MKDRLPQFFSPRDLRRLVHTGDPRAIYKIHSNYSLLTDRYMCVVLYYIAHFALPMVFLPPFTSQMPSATPTDR